jgi:hypothetical protein
MGKLKEMVVAFFQLGGNRERESMKSASVICSLRPQHKETP